MRHYYWALRVLWFYRIALDLVKWGVILSDVSSSLCPARPTLCVGRLKRKELAEHLHNFNVWNKKEKEVTKKVTYKTVPSCPSPKTTEWIKRSTRTMNFFLLQILHTTKTYSRGENAFKELIQKQEKYNPIHFAHLLHNNTQWSQNEMTSFTIFMAFCLLFYTIYNHFNFISLFLIQGRKKRMYNKSLLLLT